MIVEETARDKLRLAQDEVRKVALGIFNMIGFINFELASKYYVL